MELKDRTFTENKTGRKITIVDSFKDVAVTSSGDRVSVSRLFDANHYTEELDPNRFMQNESTHNAFASIIKGIDLTNVPDDDTVHDVQMHNVDSQYQPNTTESAVVQYDEEYEKQLLAEKYGASMDNNAMNKQQAAFDKLLNGDDGGEDIPVVQRGNQQPKPKKKKEEFKQPDYTDVRPQPQPKPEDPIITMFKNVKRKENFTLSIEIEDKIPRLDFIEMMEDSYDTSIIEFLADDMLKKMLSDPKILRNKIIEEITDRVYPDGRPEPEIEEVEDKDEVINEKVEVEPEPEKVIEKEPK